MQTFEVTREMADAIIRRRGHLHPHAEFDPAATALLVVDMQNYFVSEDERTGCGPAREITPNINRLASALRAAGGQVVWIVTEATEEANESWSNFYETHSEDGGAHRRKVMVPGQSAYEIWPQLEVLDGDTQFVKARYSAFLKAPGGDLEALLNTRGIKTLLVTGVATNVCCESTARDAMMVGFRTIMVSDGNAAYTAEFHEATMRNFISVFGDVHSTDDLLGIIGARQAAE
ncbi:MAG: isochorismatase family cysteine hydrolase [Rhodospirillales bacterium]|jgi:ureidoacrylate peracid hydrolase